MAHTWANGLHGAWYNGYVAPGSELSNLDGLLTNNLNGDGGGTWAPSAAMNVGGAGVNVLGIWIVNGQINSTASLPFTLGDSDFFQLSVGHPGQTRTILTECHAGVATGAEASFGSEVPIAWRSEYTLSTGTFGFQTFRAFGSQLKVPRAILVPFRVHNGATLASVTLTWAVGQSHTNVPESLPRWRVVKLSASTGSVTPLNSTFSGSYDPHGYLIMATPASGTAYYNGGANYTPTYTCDAGVVVDTSQYDYAVEIIDEWGPNNALVGNLYFSVLASFTSIPDMRFQT